MADEIKIWAVSGSSPGTPVPSVAQTKTEEWLEDALVANPEMLMPGLKLVGRQTRTASGWLDLLGVDQDGRLVVFELKKGTLARDAVTQVVDYCSYLESLEAPELAKLIAEQSGNLGIPKIGDFEEWYSTVSGKSPDDLRPVRMVLVGLGVDDSASRMVSFLANGSIEISLLTFHGYQYNGETLLARQAPRTDAGTSRDNTRATPGDRERALAERADSLGIGEPWRDAVDIFTQLGNYNQSPLTDGISFSLPALQLPGEAANYYGSHSLRFNRNGELRITFFPAAVDLCKERFEQQREHIPFMDEEPPNARTTDMVKRQWYCLLDSEGWKTYKVALIELAADVYDAWGKARRNANSG